MYCCLGRKCWLTVILFGGYTFKGKSLVLEGVIFFTLILDYFLKASEWQCYEKVYGWACVQSEESSLSLGICIFWTKKSSVDYWRQFMLTAKTTWDFMAADWIGVCLSYIVKVSFFLCNAAQRQESKPVLIVTSLEKERKINVSLFSPCCICRPVTVKISCVVDMVPVTWKHNFGLMPSPN